MLGTLGAYVDISWGDFMGQATAVAQCSWAKGVRVAVDPLITWRSVMTMWTAHWNVGG